MIFIFFERNYNFDGKISVTTTVAPVGLGPQDRTKKLVQRAEFLGQPYLENMFSNFRALNCASYLQWSSGNVCLLLTQ